MNARGRNGKDRQSMNTEQRGFRLAPIAQAIALILVSGGAMGEAHAAAAFSPAWFGAKNAIQSTARSTGMVNGKPISSFNSPSAQQQQANSQLQQSIANLGVAAQGIAAQQAAQAAARQAALGNPSAVPDGLGAGGLDTGSLVSSWVNAKGPTQSKDANGKSVVEIQQTADKAIANWNTFNVGKNTIVQFDQQSDWAILNRVMDPAARPSQIQGQIKSNGTVLIVNRNGIVFSGSSQVNVRNLVTAAADIDPNQFTTNGIYSAQTSGVFAPSFTNASGKLIVEAGAQITTIVPDSATQGGGYVLLMGQQVSNAGDIETRKGQVEMAAGDNFAIRKGVGTDANQSSTTRGNEISPNSGSTGQVINTGLLLAREGDVTLAGHDVQQNGVAVATTTVNTRGTIHLLNSASDATGLVTLGSNAVTTIALEDDGATALDSQRAALIAASAIQDLTRPGVATGQFDNLSKQTDRQDQGRIEIVSGGDVRFEGESLTLATGGQISVSATNRTFAADGSILDVSGQVGVNLAMASNNVLVNVQGNELRDSPDNRDSGNLANDNIMIDRRDLILVPASAADPTDRWYTAGGLLEVSGYLNNQNHGIGEWAAQGGTIQLGGKEVVAEQGSQINLSGGSYNVQTGDVAQTWLVGGNGRLYNINNAPTDMTYDGIYMGYVDAHPRWGDTATQHFYNPLIGPQKILEDGYTVGRDAGQLIINAPTSVIEGDIIATVFNGAQQNGARDAVVDGYLQSQTAVAKAGSLSFGQYGAGGLSGANDTDIQIGNVADITNGMAEGDALPSDRINTTSLDASHLNAQGFGEIDLASSKSVKVEAPLTLADGGTLNVIAPLIDIDAGITAHGGSIALGNLILIPPPGITQLAHWAQLPPLPGTTAQVTIAAGNTIDLHGVWTNALTDPDNLAGLAYLNGGSLTVETTGGITLSAGSVVDVSSGAAILNGGKTKGGNGGNVSLVTNDYENLGSTDYFATDRTAPLILDGKVVAYGFNGGGTLRLDAGQSIVIGDNSSVAGATPSGPLLLLNPNLFQSGFTNYNIIGLGGMAIGDGTVLAPVVPVYSFADGSAQLPGGSNPADAADLGLPPTYLNNPTNDTLTQRVGADLTLGTIGAFTLPQNTAITVDPGHAVSILANGQTTIEGHISAPAGAIGIGSMVDQAGAAQTAGGIGDFSLTRSIWIGDNAVLDVAGRSNIATDARGRNYGTVTDGGSIQLGGANGVASDAFIVIRPGALLDASGASGLLDVATGNTTANRVQASSDGGLIALNSYSGIYIDGDIRAAAGGAGASGGSLSMSLISRNYSPELASPAFPDGIGVIPADIQKLRNITITQTADASGLAGNLAPGAADAALQFGQAEIGVDQINAGGFDSLALNTNDLFVFKGDVNLSLGRSLSFSGGVFSVADATPHSTISLAAPTIQLNGWTDKGTTVDQYNPGLNGAKGPSLQQSDSTIAFSADLIDIEGDLRFGMHAHQGSGSLSFTDVNHLISDPTTDDLRNTSGGDIVDAAGFGLVTLASRGDVRFGDSSLITSGDIAIQAAQLYPLSGASAVLTAGEILRTNTTGGVQSGGFDPARPGTISIRGNGADQLPAMPASAFGNLSFIAATIDQGGVVRAPLGTISFNGNAGAVLPQTQAPDQASVVFRDGSLTSASANGLVMPFGGTSDGLTYNGADGTLIDLGSATVVRNTLASIATGISVWANSVVGEAGAVLDLSGGGDLTGAGFISGRGGSVDVLKTPLINANPANTFSAAGNQVYAIMPGYASAYAPVIATNGAGDPAIGRQVTIAAGVPGLAAGTYTLLPSSYALLPGAFRVEVGTAGTSATAPIALPGGSYIASGTLGVANTGIHDALPTQLILSSGQEVRSTSQYNEMSYADFARSQAAVFGNVRPRLPEDGKILAFNLGAASASGSGKSLSFAGTALFDAADDGIAGSLLIGSLDTNGVIDITAPGAAPVAGHTSIASDAINAFNAASLFIGGAYLFQTDTFHGVGSSIGLLGTSTVNLLDGAVVRAGQVFLSGVDVNVDGGATIDTRGLSDKGIDSSLGYVFSSGGAGGGGAVLAVGNGQFNFLPATIGGTVSIAGGATLLTEGSIVLAAPGGLTMGDVNFGARFLTVAQDQINVGDAAALAAAQAAGTLPAGWNLSQTTLDKLLHPSASAGVPALERLSLTAGGAINFFGSASLDASGQAGSDVQLVLNTPAIYGLGGAGDVDSITADTLVWDGIRTGAGTTASPYASKAPTVVLAGGAGTGTGLLNISAKQILFGFDSDSRSTDGATLDRVVLGFSNVNLNASDRITANSDGTLSVGQSKDVSGVLQGGNLTLATPLFAGTNGATIDYKAGGAIQAVVPAGAAAGDAAAITDLGGTVSFTGASVLLDTTVALPSGKLTLNAVKDIDLGANAAIDLSGRGTVFFDVTQYSGGGDLVMSSAAGNINQAGGSLIDVSAQNNDAGSIKATADAGSANFGGLLKGDATAGNMGGRIGMEVLDVADFAALNTQLNAAGFFGARTFDIKQGDLTVGNEVKASTVSIAVDGGALTVNGTIDASGAKVGTISLAAKNDLTLTQNAVLDTHGTQLQTDSFGAPVDADNTAHIDLTTSGGRIVLAQGTTIDMSSPDGVARGKLEINAPRLGAIDGRGNGANDIAIDASQSLNIAGASSIAVNGFWKYTDAPVDPTDSTTQIIDQAYLDGIHTVSDAFIDAADINSDLQNRLSGLKAYGAAYHLRPGVEIDSATPTGNLATKGDLDLSNYRYGPDANPAVRGSGEVGVITFRAGGDLNINGSVNDGFAPPPASPDALTVLASGNLTSAFTVTTAGTVMAAGAVLPSTAMINIPLPIAARKITVSPSISNSLPVDVVLTATFRPTVARTVTGTIFNPDGSVLYSSGQTLSTAVIWPVGTRIAAGTFFNSAILNTAVFWTIAATTLPPNTKPGVFGNFTFTADTALTVGTVLPSGMSSVNVTGPGDRQVWAIAPMLAPGSQSWSMRFVGGADLDGADSRSLQPIGSLAAGAGNVTLNDPYSINVVGTGTTGPSPGVSVVRTGTGDLEILAGGSYRQDSPYGVYTAGTAIAATGTPANDPFNVGRGNVLDGSSTPSVLGAGNSGYEATLNAQRMYYTEDGGDVVLTAQGDISGNTDGGNSALIGNWLWRQGGAVGQATAWGINFGSYVASFDTQGPHIGLDAFSGVGALGGGKVSLTAGRDIGVADGQGITVAVGGSGRVMADGSLVQTGGGALTVTAGRNVGGGGNQFVDLRGDINVATGAFGSLTSFGFGFSSQDPRPADQLKSYDRTIVAGGSFAPGDGAVNVRTRSDLAMGAIDDPGRVALGQSTDATALGANGQMQTGQGQTWFTLWTGKTAIELFAAGADLSPFSLAQFSPNAHTAFLPAVISATAAGGSIFLTPSNGGMDLMLPSPNGGLTLLAQDMIDQPEGAAGSPIGALSVALSSIATPFKPGWAIVQRGAGSNGSTTIGSSNYWSTPNDRIDASDGLPVIGDPFVFGPIDISDNSAAGGNTLSRIYAVNGDIINFSYGETFVGNQLVGGTQVFETFHRAAKPVQVMAGGDIVDMQGLILNDDPTRVSTIAAGGSIILSDVDIAGPGTLEVTAGKNIYQGSTGVFHSIGPLVEGDNRPGAGIALQAGVGAGTPGIGQVDWADFAQRYLDPANLAGPGALADQPGKVAKTYDQELLVWLQDRYGYAGAADSNSVLAYFDALPGAQQRVFLRTVYYAELTAGGREFNDPSSTRFGSYLRGRDAIASLFPATNAYHGDITMFSANDVFTRSVASGFVHTDFGGDIQFLAPGGQVVVGTEGLAPGADAGLITQGGGNIQIYSKDSLLLGLSRIMTTFGGDILAWSADGDINAGRGSKTTVVFTPPKRTYDDVGDVALAPQVPSSGAGIATLNPIPEVPAGDVDLIAPLGTIDAGEAGIRVSGNVNLAALSVVNAANIQVQGKSTGLPVIASVNVGALTNASAAATQATVAAQDVVRQQQAAARQALPSIFTVTVLGFGNEAAEGEQAAPPASKPAGLQSSAGAPYSATNPLQFVGMDEDFDPKQVARLNDNERRQLSR